MRPCDLLDRIPAVHVGEYPKLRETLWLGRARQSCLHARPSWHSLTKQHWPSHARQLKPCYPGRVGSVIPAILAGTELGDPRHKGWPGADRLTQLGLPAYPTIYQFAPRATNQARSANMSPCEKGRADQADAAWMTWLQQSGMARPGLLDQRRPAWSGQAGKIAWPSPATLAHIALGGAYSTPSYGIQTDGRSHRVLWFRWTLFDGWQPLKSQGVCVIRLRRPPPGECPWTWWLVVVRATIRPRTR